MLSRSSHMLALMLAAVLAAVMFFATPSRVSLEPERAGEPALAIWKPAKTGLKLEFAIWSDGTGLARRTISDIDAPLVVFRTSEARVASLLATIASDPVMKSEVKQLAGPDIQTTRITCVVKGERVRFEWSESISPGWPSLPEPKMQAMMTAFMTLRSAALMAIPVETWELKDKLDAQGRFRGYENAASSAPWRP